MIQNTVHVTVSGLFATYYFFGTATGGIVTVPVSNPTVGSAKRALSTSFGSVCYGSLIIALVRTMKFIADNARQNAREDGNMAVMFLACCLSCIIQCIGDILEYLNHVRFIHIFTMTEN